MTIQSTILALGLCLVVVACGSEQVAPSEERSDVPNSIEQQGAPPGSEPGEDLDADSEADEDTVDALAIGELCEPGPDPSVAADETIDPGLRGEALVKFLTGIDELVLQEEEEGVDIVYDDPNCWPMDIDGIWFGSDFF